MIRIPVETAAGYAVVMSTAPAAADYLWVSIDMTRLPEVQEAARAKDRTPRVPSQP